MTAGLVVLGVATFLGMAFQAVVGFGASLLISPVLFAVLTPVDALFVLLLLGLGINALVLFGESRRATPDWPALRALAVGVAPGLGIGAAVLALAPANAIRVAVGVVVVAAAVAQARAARRPLRPVRASAAGGAGVGVLVGALTASVAVNGPPLALWFLRLGLRGPRLRDALATALLPLNVAGLAIAAALGAPDDGADVALALALLLPLTAAGHALGRRLLPRLDVRTHTRIVVAAALVAGAYGVLVALV